MQAKTLAGLTCPSCGGTVELVEGWTNARCRYCETPLAVVGERGVVRLMVVDEIDRARALAAATAWLAKGIDKEPALRREASVEEAFLAWFPFARVQCDVIGWTLGTEVHRVRKGNQWREEHRPVERLVEESSDSTLPAAEVGEFGVARVDLRGDRLVPYDEETLRKRGMVFRPRLAPAEISSAAVDRVVEETRRRRSPDRVTFSWLAAVRRRTTLVHYPLWVFRYAFRGRTYQVLVDAQDGSLAYGKAPGNHLYRAVTLVAATALACFLGTTALQHLDQVASGNDGFGLIAGIVLALAAAVRWGYVRFRHGGVIEEGTGLVPGRRPIAASELLEKLAKGKL